jgi:MFS family permease
MPGFLLLKPRMRRLYQPYVEFLRLPHVGRLFLVAAIARMPISMTALAMTLFLRDTLGDFAQAGIVVGAYFVAIAVVSPLLGRVIDRWGPRLPLLITGWLQPLLLSVVFVAAYDGWGYALVLMAAIAAGLVPPPITTITRTLWRYRFPHEHDRRMAYALDSVMTELNFTLGPSLIGILAALSDTYIAMGVAIVCNFLAFLLFMQARVLDFWQHSSAGERHWLGPLTDRRLVLYFCLGFGLTFCLGLFEVSYPAYALAFDSPALAGILIALNGLGSAVGGALFGTWQSSRSVEQQYALALSVLVVPFVLHALFPQLAVFIVVAFFGGLAVAPALTSLTLLTNRRAPALYATEALTWSATFIISGLGGGMGAAGYFIETWSLTTTFWIGAAVVGCMALCAWGLQRGVSGESVIATAGAHHE